MAVTIESTVLVEHLGHGCAINANGISGVAPNGHDGIRITTVIVHCQNCNIDLISESNIS